MRETTTVSTVIVDELTIQARLYYKQPSIVLSPKRGFFNLISILGEVAVFFMNLMTDFTGENSSNLSQKSFENRSCTQDAVVCEDRSGESR